MDEINELRQKHLSYEQVVRQEAARAREEIAKKKSNNEKMLKQLPTLIEALKDPEKTVRTWAVWALGETAEKNSGHDEIVKTIVPALVEALTDSESEVRLDAVGVLRNTINHSSVEQLDKIKAQIIDAVENLDKYAPHYRKMRYEAAGVLVAINTKRNALLSVEINIDTDLVLRRPKPPRGSGGTYRALAFARVS